MTVFTFEDEQIVWTDNSSVRQFVGIMRILDRQPTFCWSLDCFESKGPGANSLVTVLVEKNGYHQVHKE